MYHPTRGGVRGGRDQFTWEDVKVDKHRENYIGHSIKAPVGRWQKERHATGRGKQALFVKMLRRLLSLRVLMVLLLNQHQGVLKKEASEDESRKKRRREERKHEKTEKQRSHDSDNKRKHKREKSRRHDSD